MASIAATTTGIYSGRQPAITALIATFSAVTETARSAMWATSWAGSRPAARSMASTRSGVAGTTGRPSVHPLAKQTSMASPGSATGWRVDVRGEVIRACREGSRLVRLVVRLESHPVVRAVAERLVRRLAAAAQGDGVALERELLAFRVGEADGALDQVRAVRARRDGRLVHVGLLWGERGDHASL